MLQFKHHLNQQAFPGHPSLIFLSPFAALFYFHSVCHHLTHCISIYGLSPPLGYELFESRDVACFVIPRAYNSPGTQ